MHREISEFIAGDTIMMKSIFQNDKSYSSNLKLYTRKDGLLSLILFGIYILMYSIIGILYIKVEFVKFNILIVGDIINISMIMITILFVKLRRQDLDTIGLYKGKWKKKLLYRNNICRYSFF